MILSPAEWEIVVLSLQVAGVAVVASLPFGMALAYALARRRVPLSFLVENLIQLPLVLPPVVTGLLLLIVLGPEGPVGRATGESAARAAWVRLVWNGAQNGFVRS